MVKQVGSAWKKVFRLWLPNDVLRKATAAVKPASLPSSSSARRPRSTLPRREPPSDCIQGYGNRCRLLASACVNRADAPQVRQLLSRCIKRLHRRRALGGGAGRRRLRYAVGARAAGLRGARRAAIPRTVFHAVPNVDSVLVDLRRASSRPTARRRRRCARSSRGAFAHRRKTLVGSLALSGGRAGRSREQVRAALRASASRGRARRAPGAEDFRALAARSSYERDRLPLRALAPAKINLGLFLGPTRDTTAGTSSSR